MHIQRGETGEAERTADNKIIDSSRVVLNQHIKYYETKVKGIKGSGIRKKGVLRNVMFFNNPQNLLIRILQ